MANVTLLQWKISIVSFNLYMFVSFVVTWDKSMQICSLGLRGNSCKATGIIVSLGMFLPPAPPALVPAGWISTGSYFLWHGLLKDKPHRFCGLGCLSHLTCVGNDWS